MTLEELKSAAEKYQSFLEGANGMVMFSATGPANMPLIHALIAVIADQDKRIQALESLLKASR